VFYSVLADVIATVHVAWVAFVFFGLVFILLGRALGWQWVSNRWFRGIHMAMISLVVMRCVVWDLCPLTTWEGSLREIAALQEVKGSAFGLFMHDLIHPDAPSVPIQAYHAVYAVFATLVAASFWIAPVNWRPNRQEEAPVVALPSPQV